MWLPVGSEETGKPWQEETVSALYWTTWLSSLNAKTVRYATRVGDLLQDALGFQQLFLLRKGSRLGQDS